MIASTGIIDLHCHFLHGIDDGARNLAESLELARAAVADGITASAMTPHIHPGRYPNQKSVIALPDDIAASFTEVCCDVKR